LTPEEELRKREPWRFVKKMNLAPKIKLNMKEKLEKAQTKKKMNK
jgi:hypothetical protein